MKKIFAIALALVMVLSMTSAFASYCTGGFDWTCATTVNKCGKATVEVVPYVKTNSACDEFAFVQSDCAAAINGENVYYAVKMTVDKDIDPEWLASAKVTLTVKGMKDADYEKVYENITLNEDKTEDGWVLYLDTDLSGSWTDATETKDFDIKTVMHDEVVKSYAKAKVCVTLEAEDAGKDGIVGDYYVEYVEGEDAVEAKEATKATMSATYTVAEYNSAVTAGALAVAGWNVKEAVISGDSVVVTWECATAGVVKTFPSVGRTTTNVNGTAAVKAKAGVVNALKVYTVKNAGKGELLVTYIIKEGKITDIQYTAVCGAATYATVKGFFGLEIGTCVDAKLIKANFGWKEKVESCFAWKTENATAIVDAECVVAIPKTGDASVLAWLF